jgi:hypothetical protein
MEMNSTPLRRMFPSMSVKDRKVPLPPDPAEVVDEGMGTVGVLVSFEGRKEEGGWKRTLPSSACTSCFGLR